MARSRVTAEGLDADGVRLISPADEEFDSCVDALAAPEWSQILKEAQPSIVIVSNDATRSIVALSTVFAVAGGRRAGRNSVFFVAPDAIAAGDIAYDRSSQRGIRPGGRRMIGFDFAVPSREDRQCILPEARASEEEEFAFYFPQVRNWIESTARDLSQSPHVHVSIDTAIFADGLMVGEARSELAPHFAALVQARQDLYAAVLHRLDAGQPAEEAIADCVAPDVTEMPEPDRFDRPWCAANEAKNTIGSLLRHYGAGPLPDILRRAILPQPFVVHR
jgi:hypothetical protein